MMSHSIVSLVFLALLDMDKQFVFTQQVAALYSAFIIQCTSGVLQKASIYYAGYLYSSHITSYCSVLLTYSVVIDCVTNLAVFAMCCQRSYVRQTEYTSNQAHTSKYIIRIVFYAHIKYTSFTDLNTYIFVQCCTHAVHVVAIVFTICAFIEIYRDLINLQLVGTKLFKEKIIGKKRTRILELTLSTFCDKM